jgi:hypothetical protein
MKNVSVLDTLKEDRGFGLGERDPDTLPGATAISEKEWANASRTRYWRSLRRKVQSPVSWRY